MASVLIIRELNQLKHIENRSIMVETFDIEMIEPVQEAVQANNSLFCIKIETEQAISAIAFKEEWQGIPLVIYPAGLGTVRDLIRQLPILRSLNVKFFLNGDTAQSYEAVQILSSLGIYSGIVITENADWEKLTDLMYYALCGKIAHAPIEPFQFVFDMYDRKKLVDYGTVFFKDLDRFEIFSEKTSKEVQNKDRQKFFYEYSPCAACEGWRICMGKYHTLTDKTGCRNFTAELLHIIEKLKNN